MKERSITYLSNFRNPTTACWYALIESTTNLRHTVKGDHLQAVIWIGQGAHVVGYFAERHELRCARPHIFLVYLSRTDGTGLKGMLNLG